MYEPGRLRTERFNVDVQYHSAYNFLSLRGVLAERWAHGPYFGAYAEPTQQQVTLTPPSDAESRLQAFYGLKASGFSSERIDDLDLTTRLARDWFSDVFEVLNPKRIISMSIEWFALYPVSNPDRVSKRLREAYYNEGAQLSRLKPDRFAHFHSAIDMLMLNGDDQASLIAGVVGPPHRGARFFVTADAERDSAWWFGLRYSTRRSSSDDGLAREGLDELMSTSQTEFKRLVALVMPRVIE